MNSYLYRIVDSDDSDYPAAVSFSLSAYDASSLRHLRQAFPTFVCAFRHGEIVAACGFRGADRGLVLEQYMDQPADQFLSVHTGDRTPRSESAELGAYRVKSPALTPQFSANIERLLRGKGYRYAFALSSSGAHSIENWARERTAIASAETSRVTNSGTLSVSVISLVKDA